MTSRRLESVRVFFRTRRAARRWAAAAPFRVTHRGRNRWQAIPQYKITASMTASGCMHVIRAGNFEDLAVACGAQLLVAIQARLADLDVH